MTDFILNNGILERKTVMNHANAQQTANTTNQQEHQPQPDDQKPPPPPPSEKPTTVDDKSSSKQKNQKSSKASSKQKNTTPQQVSPQPPQEDAQQTSTDDQSLSQPTETVTKKTRKSSKKTSKASHKKSTAQNTNPPDHTSSPSKSPFKPKHEMTEEEREQYELAMQNFRERRRLEKERKRKKAQALQKKKELQYEREEKIIQQRQEMLRTKEEERRKQAHESYQKRIKDLEARRKHREEILAASRKSPSKSDVPLYIRMEQQFNKQHVEHEHEKLSQALQKKKDLFSKPTEEFAAVNKDYLRFKKEKEDERRRQRELWQHELQKNKKTDLYEGKAKAMIKEELVRAKLQEEEMKRKRQELMLKQREYATQLKDKHKPKIDVKLRKEIEERATKTHLKLPSIKDGRSRSPSPEPNTEGTTRKQERQRVDTYNRKYIQSLPKERRRRSVEPSADEENKSVSPEKVRKIGNDYLAEVKQQVRQHMKKGTPSPKKAQNLEHLKYKAFKLDSKAARKEKWLREQEPKGEKQFKKQLEASKAIIDAVKMKLELLNEL